MNTKNLIIAVALLLIGIAGGAVFAPFGKHSKSIDHGSHATNSLQREGGQAAFNAIAEIVSLLEANPETDWSMVNIDALRDHLVDMNALTLSATVEAFPEEKGVRFVAQGIGKTLRALQNMVPAHANELNKMPQWSAIGRRVAGGVELIVTSDDEDSRKKISGLGFFGLMATGAHHQRHHLAMAEGNAMH